MSECTDDYTEEDIQKTRKYMSVRMLTSTVTVSLPATKRYASKPVVWVPGHIIGGAEYGPHPADIMIIGKGMTEAEAHAARHYFDLGAKLLAKELKDRGIDITTCYGTNVMKFHPPYQDMSSVPASWLREGYYFLDQEIQIVKPKFILILGSDALKAVFGKKAKISSYRGEVHDKYGAKCVVCNSPYDVLRATDRRPQFLEGLDFFAKVVNGDSIEPSSVSYTYANTLEALHPIIDEYMEFDRFAIDCEWHGESPMTGGKLLTIQISKAEREALVVELRSIVDSFEFSPSPTAAIDLVRKLLCRKHVAIYGHNLRADLVWLRDVGIDCLDQFVDNGFDTMLGSHVLSESAEHNLTACVLRETDMGRYDAEVVEYLNKGIIHGNMPRDVLLPYAAADADATFRLAVRYRSELWSRHYNYCVANGIEDPYSIIYGPADPRVKEAGYHPTPWNLYHFVELACNRAIMEMEEVGLLVDTEQLVDMIGRFERKRDEIELQIKEAVCDSTFNPRSAQQVQHLLFGDPNYVDEHGVCKYALGLTPIKTTGKRGRLWEEAEERGEVWYVEGEGWKSDRHSPSTDAETLGILADRGVYEAELLRSYRFIDQICKNFLRPEEIDETTGNMHYSGGLLGFQDDDGRVRTHISQLTETGRYRSSRPNCQNLPKGREGDIAAIFSDGEPVPPIRSAFMAREGWCLIESDYESAETYTLAYLADDKQMKEDLQMRDPDTGAKISLHSITAVTCFKLDMPVPEYDKKRKEDSQEGRKLAGLRVAAKSINFGIPYQRSGAAIARQVQREGVPCEIEDGDKWVAEWYARYVDCAAYLETCKNSVFDPGYVMNPYGRRRHFIRSPYDHINAGMQREACNAPIQGTVADALSTSLAVLPGERDRRGLQFRIVLAVHDAILIETPIEEAVAAKECLEYCMQYPEVPGTGLHYSTDTEIFDRWCEHAPAWLLQKAGWED